MSNSGRRMAIGLKYCGGCKPNYDRLALVEQIRQRIEPRAVLVCHDHPGAMMILAVQGCPTACADLTFFEHLPVFSSDEWRRPKRSSSIFNQGCLNDRTVESSYR